MRATLRITWLLLSLSLLFDSIYSENATSASNDTASVTIAPGFVQRKINESASGTESSTDTQPTKTDVSQASTPAKIQTTQEPTTTTAEFKTTADKVTTTANPTFGPSTSQPQKSNTAALLPVSASAVAHTVKHDSTPPVATQSIPTTFSPASTADSRTSAGIGGGATDGYPLGTAGTQGTVWKPKNTEHVGSTTVSTNSTTIGGQPIDATTIPSATSQETQEVKDTEKTTVSAKSHEQTESRATEPTRHTETTNAPLPSTSLPVHSMPPAAETTVTQAEKTSVQANLTTDNSHRLTTPKTIAEGPPKLFLYSLNKGHEKGDDKDLVELCRRLMANLLDGNCSLTLHNNNQINFDSVKINGKVTSSLAKQYYEEITKKPTDNRTLIAILASCGALLIMIVILAMCASHHRKPYNETQQHLTEELHTVENGYHDNPTLEVMEVQPEMQEKKMALNGEFNDSWIVPIDNLLKEDIADEEDTHL